MLKAELHSHCDDDHLDYGLSYSAEDLIREAADKDFDVLAITLHEKLYFPERYKECAENHDILLIPGVELRIDGMDVLAYNITEEQADSIETLGDLRKMKSDGNLIIAPHPYASFACSLGEELEENIDVFDAIEYHGFYFRGLRYWNTKAKMVAEKHGKPLVGNSDVHELWQLGKTSTLVDAEKDVGSFIRAIKQGKVEIETKPMTWFEGLKIVLNYYYRDLKRLFN